MHRILIEDELSNTLDRIKSGNRKVSSLFLIATPSGMALTQSTLRIRFDNARNIAENRALELGNANLALKIRAFQFRDIRPKAASEISLEHASKLLGHTDQEITLKVYRRVGEVVKPTK